MARRSRTRRRSQEQRVVHGRVSTRAGSWPAARCFVQCSTRLHRTDRWYFEPSKYQRSTDRRYSPPVSPTQADAQQQPKQRSARGARPTRTPAVVVELARALGRPDGRTPRARARASRAATRGAVYPGMPLAPATDHRRSPHPRRRFAWPAADPDATNVHDTRTEHRLSCSISSTKPPRVADACPVTDPPSSRHTTTRKVKERPSPPEVMAR